MNDHDRANLEFILNASKETLADWYNSLSKDDLAYAKELVQAANSEFSMRLIELNDNVQDVTLANNVLDKYRLQ